jgi:hypothetical protein
MSSKKEIKRQDTHLLNVELNQLKDLIPLVKEYKSLLQELEVSSVAEFELKINERSGFVNASMSATAYGLEIPYKRLLEMQKSLDGKLSLEDLTPTNKLKPTIIEKITDRNTVYFTDAELKTKAELNKLKEIFNKLDFDVRRNMMIDRSFRLDHSPFSIYK